MSSGEFTADQTRRYALQIVTILETLHSRGITHRDIKFENFMLDKSWNLKLIDFGTAQLAEDNKSARALKRSIEDQVSLFLHDFQKRTHRAVEFDIESQEVGTKLYSPPEFIEFHESSPMWDFWSFGGLIRRHVVQTCNRQISFLGANSSSGRSNSGS